MKIINLTPHAITITGLPGITPSGVVVTALPSDITIPPSGTIARAGEYVQPAPPLTMQASADAADMRGQPMCGAHRRETPCPDCATIDVPTSWVTYARLEDLPAPQPGVCYVVSLVAAQAAVAMHRSTDDLFTPGEQVRDELGRVIGCRSLARVGRGHRVFRWRDQRDAFVAECRAQGGSSDVSAEREAGHLGRYARNYTSDRLAGKPGPTEMASFFCSTRRGRGVHLIGVPFGTREEMDAAYAVLASGGATPNDATDAERAIATTAVPSAVHQS